MQPDTDDAAVGVDSAIQADAYIDALLTGHRRSPVVVVPGSDPRATDVREAIDLLERGLPRFHPSFLFEEWLAGQLRRAATRSSAESSSGYRGEVVPLGLMPRPPFGPTRLGPRRLFVGGAIASGVSIGAAVFALRRRRD
ncbi:MAG: hypothetical protein ABIP53_11955 [Candidatus Limnocylindrales bacterium]